MSYLAAIPVLMRTAKRMAIPEWTAQPSDLELKLQLNAGSSRPSSQLLLGLVLCR